MMDRENRNQLWSMLFGRSALTAGQAELLRDGADLGAALRLRSR